MKRIFHNHALLFTVLLVAGILLSVTSGPRAEGSPASDEFESIIIKRGNLSLASSVLREVPDPDRGRASHAGSIVVTFRPGTTTLERSRVNLLDGARGAEQLLLRDSIKLRVAPQLTESLLGLLRKLPGVKSAEPDLIVRALGSPNDPCFTAVPNPCSTATSQWGMTKIRTPQAWDVSTGSSASRVAVLDCGIYEPGSSTFLAADGIAGHPDLRNGKVVARVDFTSSPYGADDICNHGTHVAGIAAANTNNGVGVAGVGHKVSLVNVKVLGDNGLGSSTSIINGIMWVAGCDTNPCGPRRADVINMSLGAAGSCPVSVQSAINTAWNRGVVVVAAAGNSNSSGSFWPAACDNVIAVSASTTSDTRASFSNYGSWVDVAAPGAGILSTDYIGNYAVFNGTSMAAPHVAGLAGLLWSSPYGVSNADVVTRILSTAHTGALAGSVNGRIDAAAALAGGSAAPPAPVTSGWFGCASSSAQTSASGDKNGFERASSGAVTAAACTDNGAYAIDNNSGTSSSTSCSSSGKDRHVFYDYGIALPEGASITGIEVRVDAWVDSSSGTRRMCIELSQDGGLTWTAAKQTSNLSKSSSSSQTLGSASDLWGKAWAAPSLTNGNFRVRVTDVASSTSRDFRLDWLAVRVTYSLP